MKTFDQVASLDNATDNGPSAFAIANEVAKTRAAEATSLPPDVFAPHFDNNAFNAQLDNAYRSHVTANLPKPEVEKSTPSKT